MKEFPINIPLKGLSPKEGVPGADLMIGLRPTKSGLESVQAPYLLAPLSASWPFPQIFDLVDYTIVATVDGLYQRDGIQILTGLPNMGYPWDFTIIGDFIIGTNNNIVVKGRGYDLEVDEELLIPAGRSICNVGGQLVIAGPWMYGEHQSKNIAWSQVGRADFTIDEGNMAGNRYAECGEVLRVVRHFRSTLAGLKYGFLVFGREGVSSFSVEDHPIIYAQKKLSGIGVHSQLAVTGTDMRAFFVGTNYKLYAIEDAKIVEVGFEREFRLAGSEIALSYDKDKNQVWAGF